MSLIKIGILLFFSFFQLKEYTTIIMATLNLNKNQQEIK